MAKPEPLIDLQISSGERLALQTLEEIKNFVAQENAFWVEVSQRNTNRNPFNVVVQRIGVISSAISSTENSDDVARTRAAFSSVYSGASAIPYSQSSDGQALLIIAQKFGYVGAAGALTVGLPHQVYNEPLGNISKAAFVGAVEFVGARTGLSTSSIAVAKRTVAGLNGRATQVLSAIERAGQELSDTLQTEYSKSHDARETLFRERYDEMHASHALYSAQSQDSLERFENTYKAYLEQMKLKAPVEYWREKASSHRKAARELRNWLAGFFALMIGGYLIAVLGLGQHLATFLSQFQGNAGALIIISAAFALLASLPLWIGRLLVKFYLSEHHLATDAREREVMTQTYLALTADGVVDEKDRTLILAALFRNTPDGVVKDNTQPETSPAAILSKLLDAR